MLLSGHVLRAQDSSPNSKPPAQSPDTTTQPPQKQEPEAKKPRAAPSEPKPAAPSDQNPGTSGQIKLEAPEVAPAEQKPAAGQQKPAAPPSQNPPGPIKLENPETAPQPQKQPAPVAPTEQPNQTIIESIAFRGNRRIPASNLRARIFSSVGGAYDENTLERDLHALWNTGFFDDVRIEVSDGKTGKIITFRLQEKKLIRSIDYKGLSSVSQSDVLDRFKERKVGLSIESQYDPVVIKRAQVVIEQLLAEHGRQFATARARTRNIPPNSVALTFIVVEGPTVKVGDIRFQGNTVFSSHRLERTMKYSKPWGAPPFFYWFHKTYDKQKIQADLEQIRELYQDHGYFFALPKEPQVKMKDTRRPILLFFLGKGRGKNVDITIPVEEGAQYHLGKFVIRGSKLFKEEVVTRMFPLKSGDVFNLSKVRKSIENYTKLYGSFGYINFTAQPDIEPDRKKQVINLALDFEEEKQYTVHRIEFTGNTKTRDKVIRRELLTDEGAVFSTTFWDYSVLKINQLGFFDPIKKEDYEIRQNNKDNTVDIEVKLKEKGRNSIGFSGGVSGLAGNFVGINYATNNFLGLGETLSVQLQFGTFEKLYSFGFTKPYLYDRPITTGFTVFKSSYHFDQLRYTAAYSGINPTSLEQTVAGQTLFQNFQQNSSGFTAFANYPLRRSFARLGLTYSFSVSSVETFSAASTAYFNALAFTQYKGPNQLSGITSSQIMPTYLYNTTNSDLSPTRGKYISASLAFSGSFLGGNVNTIRPTIEFKYFHPAGNKNAEKPNVVAFHFLASTIAGYGGLVPPPYSRIYMGGEYDLRGFDIYTVSPVGFFPTTTSVCNRDNAGNPIMTLGSNGRSSGTCGSSTTFPYNTIQFAGGDTELLTNFEYRIPIVGPVELAYFVDAGVPFILYPNQLKFQPNALESINKQFPYFPTPDHLAAVSSTNFKLRSSTGLQLFALLPIVNAPFRLYYGYNWLRLNTVITPPQHLPPMSLFPNEATYNDALKFFAPLALRDRKGLFGFTVGRTF